MGSLTQDRAPTPSGPDRPRRLTAPSSAARDPLRGCHRVTWRAAACACRRVRSLTLLSSSVAVGHDRTRCGQSVAALSGSRIAEPSCRARKGPRRDGSFLHARTPCCAPQRWVVQLRGRDRNRPVRNRCSPSSPGGPRVRPLRDGDTGVTARRNHSAHPPVATRLGRLIVTGAALSVDNLVVTLALGANEVSVPVAVAVIAAVNGVARQPHVTGSVPVT